MTDDRKSAFAFLAGSLGGIVTMAIHPTAGNATLTPDQVEHLAMMSGIAHSIALVSFLLLFLGAIGLTRRLASRESPGNPDRLALTALATYAFAAVALMLATSVSGFIIPGILRHMMLDAAADAPQWKLVIYSVFQFNQAFARIYSVAASLAILLWSISALRNGGLSRGVAIYGCVISPVVIILIAVGHLRLDVHGMAIVVVAHAIWLIIAAIELLRHPDPQPVSLK